MPGLSIFRGFGTASLHIIPSPLQVHDIDPRSLIAGSTRTKLGQGDFIRGGKPAELAVRLAPVDSEKFVRMISA